MYGLHGHTELVCIFLLFLSYCAHTDSDKISKTIQHFSSSSSPFASSSYVFVLVLTHSNVSFSLWRCGKNETETPNHIKLNFPLCIYSSIPHGFCFSLLMAIIETYVADVFVAVVVVSFVAAVVATWQCHQQRLAKVLTQSETQPNDFQSAIYFFFALFPIYGREIMHAMGASKPYYCAACHIFR